MRLRVPLIAVSLLGFGCGARTGLDVSASETPAPVAGGVSAEACDGTDEDRDGRVDEGLGWVPKAGRRLERAAPARSFDQRPIEISIARPRATTR